MQVALKLQNFPAIMETNSCARISCVCQCVQRCINNNANNSNCFVICDLGQLN